MKKYTKPMIVFESFTLSTNIALDCGQKANNHDSFYTCGLWLDYIDLETMEVVNGQAFSGSWSGCKLKLDVDDLDNNGICYDVPAGATPIFNS